MFLSENGYDPEINYILESIIPLLSREKLRGRDRNDVLAELEHILNIESKKVWDK